MRVLILAPFEVDILAVVAAGHPLDIVHENWLETGEFQDPVELGNRIEREGFEAVVIEGDFLFSETFDLAPQLKFAGICRATVSQVDIGSATDHGIVVVNTPARNANAVAELTIGLIFASARRIVQGNRYIESGKWRSPLDAYTEMRSNEIRGRTLGIVGFGAIGRRIAQLATALGMKVIAYDPVVTPQETENAGATWSKLEPLLGTADFVTLHAPAPADGRPLFNERLIAMMKPASVLINTASAELVDHDALKSALVENRIAGAALDVLPSHPVEPGFPLIGLDNVILTPHIGGATAETVQRHSRSMSEDLVRFARAEKPLNFVNPEVWDTRRGNR
ncbi:MAG: NAD(P)-dependent oxidoreductase [Dehalococcoidia bacterium]|nr:NAD(P)-dependent oxidoreductase [Dehalococcoidia bacterium]